jgi:two-component system NarL family response regulator
LIRSALQLLLTSSLGYDVVDVSSATEAVYVAAARTDIDVVMLDVCMPEHDGLWALTEIRKIRPELPIVMLSYDPDEDAVTTALDSGAAGFLVKDATIEQVAESIDTALTGRGVYIHPLAAKALLPRRRVVASEGLTTREREVLAMIADGATNDAIASMLFISEKTVKTHISAIFRKLGVSNRTQAAALAVKYHLASD